MRFIKYYLPHSIHAVRTPMQAKILYNDSNLICLSVRIQHWIGMKRSNQHLDFSALAWFPQISWNVEKYRMKEEHKCHPLIVFMKLLFALRYLLGLYASWICSWIVIENRQIKISQRCYTSVGNILSLSSNPSKL